ncbi:MAG: MFS transporter, partial [Paracoccaceae bacterium]
MAPQNVPLDLTDTPTPGVRSFAILAGLDAAIRGTLISAMPLVVYGAMGDAELTSYAYFAAGVVALIWGLMVPWGTRFIPRRWMYTGGCGLYLV